MATFQTLQVNTVRKLERDGHETYFGFVPEMMDAMRESCNFSIYWVFGEKHLAGFPNKNGSWNGVLGMLQRKEVDLCAGALAVTLRRSGVTTFMPAYIEVVVTLVMVDPAFHGNDKRYNIGAFVEVFRPMTWSMVLTFALILLFLFMLWIIISGQCRRHNFFDVLFQNIPVTLNHVPGNAQMSFSRNLFFMSTTAFVMVTMSYYEGSLTSFMTARQKPPRITAFKDVLDFGHKIIVQKGTAPAMELEHAPEGTGKRKVFDALIRGNHDAYFDYYDDAARIMWENPNIVTYTHEYALSRNKRFISLMNLDDRARVPVALAFPLDSDLTGLFQYQMVRQYQSGVLSFIKSKWVPTSLRAPKDTCGVSVDELAGAEPLGFRNLLFLSLELLAGVLLALAIYLAEVMLGKFTRKGKMT